MFTKLFGFLFIFSYLFAALNEDFYQSFEVNKEKDWEMVIKLGEKALKERSDPKIHARLASSYFYLGRYDEMKKHIDHCLEESLDVDSEELLVRSLYLLSAYHRSQDSYEEARRVIDKALNKARKIKNNPLLAKVLFNTGAAEADDPKGNLDYAKLCYEEALTLVDPHADDTHRLLLRLGRVYLLQNSLQAASSIITQLSKENLVPRTKVHFYNLALQIAQAKNNPEEEANYYNRGITLATQLKMNRDIIRFKSLKERSSRD